MNYFFLKGRGADLPGNMLGLIFLGPLGGLLVVTSRWCPPQASPAAICPPPEGGGKGTCCPLAAECKHTESSETHSSLAQLHKGPWFPPALWLRN